jgi:ubiquinone/menaquinone biosynthesis C-methylase UbiE
MKDINTYEVYQQLAKTYSSKIDYKPHNAFYDRPNTLSLLPEVENKKILDAGCGPGKYAEILMARGAEVTGIDLSDNMIEEAKARNKGKGAFHVHDITTPLHFLADNSFDIVICPLVLNYIKDWNQPLSEFHRVLIPGGLLVISMQHPFFDYIYFRSKNYFEAEKVKCTWRGFGDPIEVESYRKPLSNHINDLIVNGFLIDKMLEPLPSPEFREQDEKGYEELMQFPGFLCIRAVKK